MKRNAQKHKLFVILGSMDANGRYADTLILLPNQSRTQSNACSRVRLALALGKQNELCNFIGCGEINRYTPCARHSMRDFCGK